MYVISLVFLGFALRKYKDQYIPASLTMVLWFLVNAVLARPTDLVAAHMALLQALERLLFTVMIVLLLWLCVLRKKPLKLDWVPLIGTLLAAALRIGQIEFALHATLCAVAVWHIWWMSRFRFIK